jgi:hypothetical protein
VAERVSLGDIESKLRQLGSDAQASVASAATTTSAVAGFVVVGVLLLAGVYVFGRRRGRKEAPVLEIRRI